MNAPEGFPCIPGHPNGLQGRRPNRSSACETGSSSHNAGTAWRPRDRPRKWGRYRLPSLERKMKWRTYFISYFRHQVMQLKKMRLANTRDRIEKNPRRGNAMTQCVIVTSVPLVKKKYGAPGKSAGGKEANCALRTTYRHKETIWQILQPYEKKDTEQTRHGIPLEENLS